MHPFTKQRKHGLGICNDRHQAEVVAALAFAVS